MIKLQNLINRADTVYQKLSSQTRTFFNDDLRLQAMFMFKLNKALNNLVCAYMAKHNGQLDKAKDYIETALESAAKLRAIKSQAEHGRFEGWYENDKLFRMKGLHQKITDIKQRIKVC